ncbi:MAG: alkaline phosphatase D family protein, partial [Methylococcaceae bacterium]
IGKFKTAIDPATSAAVRFAFSGDMDGLMRPYALASTIPAQNFDFFVNLGDVIYENASNAGATDGKPGVNNSPSVTLSGTVPAPSATGATIAQLFTDYSKKYREQFQAVNAGGQNSLQTFYAAQGNYTLYDNHELGNRQYINGGAPAGGSVGDMPSGAGVDARIDSNDVNTSGTFINKTLGFQTLQQVYLNYQPIADRGVVNTPQDPRMNGTKQQFMAQAWGKNALFFNTDARSYRDIRIKTAANADETTAPRANNPKRTMLGVTQLALLEQALFNAQSTGIVWKFVTTSDPIDQIGPIGGALTLTNLPNFGTGVNGNGAASTYSAPDADAGKSWQGGYRAERNALLKYIADNKITNVVFLSTDDHQNRINELTYSPTGETEKQASYVKVPYTFEIVAGPLGATGPDLITNHTFAMAQQYANSIFAAQSAAGIEPLGLQGYPGLKNVSRLNDPNAGTTPSAVDFYSPDTFNYNALEISASGQLTVTSWGIVATAQNSASEYDASKNPIQKVFNFQIDPVANTTPPLTCLLNWAESAYPKLFGAAGAVSQVQLPYTYRYYKNTDAYVGVSSVDNHVYYLAAGVLQDVGALSGWLKTAGCDK